MVDRKSKDVDLEIDEAMNDANLITYKHRIPFKISQNETKIEVNDEDFEQYDLTKGRPMETLDI